MFVLFSGLNLGQKNCNGTDLLQSPNPEWFQQERNYFGMKNCIDRREKFRQELLLTFSAVMTYSHEFNDQVTRIPVIYEYFQKPTTHPLASFSPSVQGALRGTPMDLLYHVI